jgi:hypothetical protein
MTRFYNLINLLQASFLFCWIIISFSKYCKQLPFIYHFIKISLVCQNFTFNCHILCGCFTIFSFFRVSLRSVYFQVYEDILVARKLLRCGRLMARGPAWEEAWKIIKNKMHQSDRGTNYLHIWINFYIPKVWILIFIIFLYINFYFNFFLISQDAVSEK